MSPRTHATVSALALATALLIAPPAAVAEDPGYTAVALPADSSDFVLDAARQRVFVAAGNSVAVVGLDGVVQRSFAELAWPRSLALGGDGSTVYVIESDQARVQVIDAASLAIRQVGLPESVCPDAGAFSGGRFWFGFHDCQSYAGGLGSLDPATGAFVDSGLSLPTGVSLSPAGPGRLLVLAPYEKVALYDVTGGTPVQKGELTGEDCCDGAAYLPLTGQVAVRSGAAGSLTVYRAPGLSDPAPLSTVVEPWDVAVSPDGRHLAVYDGSGERAALSVVDVSGGLPGAENRRYAMPDAVEPARIAFTGDGRILALGGDPATAEVKLFVLGDAGTYLPSIEVTAPAAVEYKSAFDVSGTLKRGPGGAVPLALTRVDGSGTYRSTVTTAADGTFAFRHDPGRLTGPIRFTLDYAGDAGHRPATWTATVTVRPVPWDFNADGYADVAVGTPDEDTGDATDTGQFHVFAGTASGVTVTGSRALDQNTPGLDGSNEDGDMLGRALASGDFNGDGYADLAVAAPGESDGAAESGMAEILYGSANGLATMGSTSIWSRAAARLTLGWSLAAGDFDGDGRDDIALGAPGTSGGGVEVYSGTPTGPVWKTWLRPVGDPVAGERFGWSLATGDIDGDHFDDLAVGAPGDTGDKGWSTGAVLVYKGGRNGLPVDPRQRISKETPGVPGTAGKYEPSTGDGADEFGLEVALADFNGDGRDDLAASAPGSLVSGVTDAGTVTILYSDGSKLGTAGAAEISQDTPGIVGLPGDNDFFGDNLAAGDSNGDGRADLAVFSYGDEYLSVIPGTATGLSSGASVWWSQETAGIPGSQEAGDKWGASLRFLSGAKPALLVGAPGEDDRQGAFTVVYIGSGGLTGTGATYFGEDSPGVPGAAENGDLFGTF
ncbi:hypothetical protein Afil01_19130 [Actinorhabdospora filicis]|uniref:FG-GAP repeat protein n=1 Tax=Actinorhabdospora filicis TaxID=1785913 RepID=A0A9W6W937_9ACTN|nr:FG-GAP-like repeat-containing protein [Actinorhabdospora filicis]GLZ77106.1 hypothetical protein Afil01_19130 [Actinorhabdospora filicis]